MKRLMIILLLLLVACTAENNIVPEENLTVQEEVLETCDIGWECQNNNSRIYYNADCTIANNQSCSLGCNEGKCLAKICERGYKCKGSYYVGLQTEDCQWITSTKCEYGCSNNTCNEEPVVNETMEEKISKPKAQVLDQGDEVTLGNYSLTIYNIEEDRVKLRLGERESSWLEEGQNFTAYEFKITVKAILFQPYMGGKKAVVYEVN